MTRDYVADPEPARPVSPTIADDIQTVISSPVTGLLYGSPFRYQDLHPGTFADSLAAGNARDWRLLDDWDIAALAIDTPEIRKLSPGEYVEL